MSDRNDRAVRDISIDDRRVNELFETRREAHKSLTEAEMMTRRVEMRELGNPEKGRMAMMEATNSAHGAVKAYIIAAEDIIRDGSDEAKYYWGQHTFGRIRFAEDEDIPPVEIVGLDGIIRAEPVIKRTWTERMDSGFMIGHERKHQETKTIPISVLWDGYRKATYLLSERGFEIKELETNEWEI